MNFNLFTITHISRYSYLLSTLKRRLLSRNNIRQQLSAYRTIDGRSAATNCFMLTNYEHFDRLYFTSNSFFRCLSSSSTTSKKTRKVASEAKADVKEHLSSFKENIFTVPNLLCVARIGLTPFISYLVLTDQFDLGLSLFALAGVTDLLDGYIARNYKNQQSMIGSFLDPMADKLLIATLFLSLTAVQLIPVPLTALIIARDVGLMGAGFIVRYRSLPHPKSIRNYFDVTYATAKLSPTLISKVNTAFQLLLVAATLGAPVFDYVNHDYLHALWYITAASTVVSGLSYIVTKDTYKILKSSTKAN